MIGLNRQACLTVLIMTVLHCLWRQPRLRGGRQRKANARGDPAKGDPAASAMAWRNAPGRLSRRGVRIGVFPPQTRKKTPPSARFSPFDRNNAHFTTPPPDAPPAKRQAKRQGPDATIARRGAGQCRYAALWPPQTAFSAPPPGPLDCRALRSAEMPAALISRILRRPRKPGRFFPTPAAVAVAVSVSVSVRHPFLFAPGFLFGLVPSWQKKTGEKAPAFTPALARRPRV